MKSCLNSPLFQKFEHYLVLVQDCYETLFNDIICPDNTVLSLKVVWLLDSEMLLKTVLSCSTVPPICKIRLLP